MPEKKIVLVFPFNLLSHYLRCLVLAERYYSCDSYDIRFVESGLYGHYLQRAGYKTFLCEQFDAERVMSDSRLFNFSWLNENDINRVFESQVDCIRTYQPDLVIGDMAPTLKMAAEITGVRCLSLLNGYMTPYSLFGRSLPTKHPAYRYLHLIPQNVLNPLTGYGEAISFRKIHKPFKNLRHKHKLKEISNYLDEMQGDENLICDLPELFPQRELPINYKFIRPLIFRDPSMDNSWLADIDRSKPVIFVSMGSTGEWERLRFLNERKYSVFTMITAGDKAAVLTAPHISSRSFVEISEVLELSSLIICHGGNGTIYHGLLAGVFMLCLTSHFEQEWNVRALERVGYGQSADQFGEVVWWTEINRLAGQKMKPYFKEQNELFQFAELIEKPLSS